jgi:hypothetical protein
VRETARDVKCPLDPHLCGAEGAPAVEYNGLLGTLFRQANAGKTVD